ncbi:MAG: alpha-N-arabinofuranosidase [Bacteroidetes bacterium]|nr:MAG: alpha-N-arabinofuranosidase [Bacteroidota bacterium]
MRKLVLALLLLLPLKPFGQTATIKIDYKRTIAEIDPKIYGVFMEPIHFNGARLGLPDTTDFNTLYGNLYDPSSPLANEDGFRKDYIDALKELKVTNMRWPGGNFLMGYDWKDGIGPKDKRPVRINLAWGSTDNNHVGTDEWIKLNKAIGSENVVAVNLGLGTIRDATYWVEYCNYKAGTYYSDLRAKNGNAQPFNVKIWDLGNEVDGLPWELGHKTADEYVEIAREASKAMKAVDHNIKLVASGSSYYEPSGKWVEWNRKVLDGIGDKIDYLSIHRYWEGGSPNDYYSYIGNGAIDFDDKIKIVAAQIQTSKAQFGFKNPVYLSVDEWGTFSRNFMGVLPIAQCLNSFIRHADVVKMANFTLATSLLSSDPKKGTFKSPLFYTFKLFSNNCLGNSIDTYIDCDTFNTQLNSGIPYLDVTAVYSKTENSVFINVINRSKDRSIQTNIVSVAGEFSGNAEATEISADDLKLNFSIDKQADYRPIPKQVKLAGNKLSYTFLPHSFTQIKVNVSK